MKLQFLLAGLVLLLVSEGQATYSDAETARLLTEKTQQQFKDLKFYPGSTFAKEKVMEATELLPFVSLEEKKTWSTYLLGLVIGETSIPDFSTKSERWIQGYNNFLIKIIRYLDPIVKVQKEECDRLYSSDKCFIYNTARDSDHWAQRKN